MGTRAARATTTRAISARVRRVMVMPGPSSSGALAVPAVGRAAAAGPRERVGEPPLVLPREVLAAGREEVLPPARLAPDAETGRLVDRGAPGRLLLMRRGYNLALSFLRR